MADGIECKLSQDGEVMGGVMGSETMTVDFDAAMIPISRFD